MRYKPNENIVLLLPVLAAAAKSMPKKGPGRERLAQALGLGF